MLNIIANLNCGKGRGRKNVNAVSEFLISNNVPFSFSFTERKGHAEELARKLTANGEDVAVLGGDGSFHEVLNGVVDPFKSAVGFIPSGRGNDFARSADLSLDPVKAVKAILSGKTKYIDYIDVGDRRCLNVAGTGLDIDVLERVEGHNGQITYVLSLIYCLTHFEPYHITVRIGEETHVYDCIMAGVCNGIAFGGNIRLAPVAKIDDGKLDVIVMQMPEDKKIMKVLPKFVKGKHMDLPITKHFICDEVNVESDRPIELDGEIYRDKKLNCKIVKGGLKTFVTT